LELLLEMYGTDGLLPRSDTWGDVIAALATQGASPTAAPTGDHAGGNFGSAYELFPHGDTAAAEEVLLFNFLSQCPPQIQQKFLVDAISTLCRSNSTEKARQLLGRLHPYRAEHLAGWEVLLEHAAMHQGRGAAQAVIAAFTSASGQSAPVSMNLKLLEACVRTRDFDRLFQITDKLLAEYRNNDSSGGRGGEAGIATGTNRVHGAGSRNTKDSYPPTEMMAPRNALGIPKHVGLVGKPIGSGGRSGSNADGDDTTSGNYSEVVVESRPTVDLFNCILEACLEAGDGSRFDDYLVEMEGFGVAQNARTLSLTAVKHVTFGRTDLLDSCVQGLVRSIVRTSYRDSSNRSDIVAGSYDSTPGSSASPPTSKINAAAESILSSLGFPRVTSSKHAASPHSDTHVEIARSEQNKVSRLLGATELASDTALKAGVSASVLVNEYLGPVVDALVSRGLWGLAEKLLARLQADTGSKCDQLCYKYTMALAEAGRIEDAANFAEKCAVQGGIKILCELSAWHRILQRAKELRKPEEAQYVMDRLFISVGPHLLAPEGGAVGEAPSLRAVPDALCWALLVGTYADAGRVDEAVDAMQVTHTWTSDDYDRFAS
jgi:hypothetical protein